MTIRELAKSYDITEDKLREVALTTITQEYLEENIKATGEISNALTGTIKRVLNQNGFTIQVNEENEVDTTSTEDVSDAALTKQEAATKTSKKESLNDSVINTDIKKTPAIILRKFFASNYNVKPEKIFFMDDKSVAEKINEKYIVLERKNDYIFIKRNTNIISIKKEV